MTAVYFFFDDVSDDLHDASSFIIDRNSRIKDTVRKPEVLFHGIVLSDIIEYINDTRSGLVGHSKLYSTRLEHLGVVMERRTGTTYLNIWNVAAIEDLQAYKRGRLLLLIFNEGVHEALKQATSLKHENEGIIIAKADKKIDEICLILRIALQGHSITAVNRNQFNSH
ncbi:unnamed protein product [Mytilus coruscus]|uniref:Uncharacterized protein n=1 Tax=Mytilus coruscus TaxID=42192 RepID=A0A6J8BWV0_MYTCO|nr:unnamed protein product [Mytilus coruscus]